MKNTRKAIAMIALVAVIVCATVAGTVAFLKDDTDAVVNTFTPSDIDVELTETTGDEYQMIPGVSLEKDPVVEVDTDVDCYVFVKVEESFDGITVGTGEDAKEYGFSDFLTYSVNTTDWKALGTSYPGVYYKEVAADDTDTKFYVLKGDEDNENGCVTVSEKVTKEMMEALTDDNCPELIITAFAIQKAGFDTAAAAWAELNPAPAEEPAPETH